MKNLKEICIKKIKDAQDNDDTEAAHELADMAICDFLIGLGYDDLVEEYETVHKWYA